jgi:hypothetical protein
LEVSADVARIIVGVTGAAVKQLQDRTGATVQVSRIDRGEHDDGNRSVVVSGAWPCVDAAVEEVRRVMSKYQPRNRERERERDRDRGRKREIDDGVQVFQHPSRVQRRRQVYVLARRRRVARAREIPAAFARKIPAAFRGRQGVGR